jgi:hypothetical protein
VSGYREFWNTIYYGSSDGFAGTFDITEYWLRIALVVAVGLFAGVASSRFRRLRETLTILAIALWALSVGPFVLWAASCGGCGSSASYDSARSYEAMVINQAWGGLLATAVASVWIGTLAARRLR